jgi:hypothetical protein
LTWSAPSTGGDPIAHYNVYRSDAQAGTYVLIGVPTTATYTDTTVINGNTYWYQVSANNTAGEGPKSVAVSSVPSTVPGTASGLTAIGGNSKSVLNWAAPADNGGSSITHYNVYRSDAQAGTYVLIGVPTTATYTDTTVINGNTYWYQVSANNTAGEGPKTSAVSSAPFGVPNSPTGLTPITGSTQVTLNWTAPLSNGGNAIDYYVVFQNGIDVAHLVPLTITITGLTNGQTYVFMVAAHNSAGNGVNSTPATAVPSASLLVIINFPSADSYVNSTNVNVQWIVSNSPTGYNVSIDNGVVHVLTAGTLSYTFTGLAEGSHTVVVIAHDSNGKTSTSTVHFSIDINKPVLNIVSPIAGSTTNGTSQTVVWTASDSGSGIGYYWVKVDSSAWSNLTVQSKLFTGLASGQHTLVVRAYDLAGNFNETSRSFTTNSSAASKGAPDTGVMIAAVALLVTAILVLVFVMRERRPETFRFDRGKPDRNAPKTFKENTKPFDRNRKN